MSSRQLEEIMEERQANAIAEELGIGREELDLLQWEIEENSSSDGLVYGYIIRFHDTSEEDILAKISDLRDGCWVPISLPDDEPEPDED